MLETRSVELGIDEEDAPLLDPEVQVAVDCTLLDLLLGLPVLFGQLFLYHKDHTKTARRFDEG